MTCNNSNCTVSDLVALAKEQLPGLNEQQQEGEGSSSDRDQRSFVLELVLKSIVTFAAADKPAANTLHSAGAYGGVIFNQYGPSSRL